MPRNGVAVQAEDDDFRCSGEEVPELYGHRVTTLEGRRANSPTATPNSPQMTKSVGRLRWGMEVSGYLVGSLAFKASATSDPRWAGSIPVHLRHAIPFPAGHFGHADESSRNA